MSERFYVYAYLDPRKPTGERYHSYTDSNYWFDYEPIYIGKGSGDRINCHMSRILGNENNLFLAKLRSIVNDGFNPIKLKILDNLYEDEAFGIEEEFIKSIGRYPNGPLTNMTNGGDGLFGMQHWTVKYPELKEKWISKNLLGKNNPRVKNPPLREKNPMWGNGHKIAGNKHYLSKMSPSEKEEWLNKYKRGSNNPNSKKKKSNG